MNLEKRQAFNHYWVFVYLCHIPSPLYPFDPWNFLQNLSILRGGSLLLTSYGCTRCGSNIEERTGRLRILVSKRNDSKIFVSINLTECLWNVFCYFWGTEIFLLLWFHHLVYFLINRSWCIEGFWIHFYVLTLCFFSCLMLVFLLISFVICKNFFNFFCQMISSKAMLNYFVIFLNFIYF